MTAKPRQTTTPEEEGIELYPDAMERLARAVKTAARHGPIAAETIRKTPRKPRQSASMKSKRS
jgi:predicted ATPase